MLYKWAGGNEARRGEPIRGTKPMPKTAERTKNDSVVFRLNRADRLELEAEAERRRMTLSELIRTRLLQQREEAEED